MKTYKLIARPEVMGLMTPLTEDLLVRAVAGLVVRELSQDAWGHYTIDVRLDRPTDSEALDEIKYGVERFGFTVLETEVSTWASQETEMAVLLALGGGSAGALSRNPLVAFIALAAGAIVGRWAGAEMHQLVARYEARRHYRGGWAFSQLPLPSAQGPQPGFSPA